MRGGAALDTVGPGSVLGGRYVLRRRLDDADHASSWQAHDETLDRLVHVRALAPEHPHAQVVLDAARRAAAVEDSRLVRVLDVGADDAVTFVVTEWLAADPLETRLQQGPLAADSARTVVGEASLALEAARRRGVHHLRLSPRVVHVLDDGSVKIADLATAAALDGLEIGGGEGEVDSDEATRTDARDLVALAYAALTATWPLPDGSDLPGAPRVGGAPVAPSHIVSGAPADLDTICAQTFAGAGGPDSPAELARQIAPWGRQRQAEGTHGGFPHLLPLAQRPSQSVQTSGLPRVGPTAVLQGLGSRWDDGHDGHDDDDVGGDEDGDVDSGDRFPPGQRVTDDEQRRSRTALALVGTFVVLFLALAYYGLRGLGDNAFVPRDAGSRSPAATTAAASPSATATGSSSPPAATSTGQPIRVASARGFDPEGDGRENNAQAARAVDANTATAWTSDRYTSAQFGGLKKGVGLLLDLGSAQTVTSVQVQLAAGGGTIQLRTASGTALGPELDTVQNAAGTVTLRPRAPLQASQLVLWFTLAAKVEGGYRAEVAEVVVS